MTKRDHREKVECECGCGRVGHFQKYATPACKQRAYRNRKKAYSTKKIETVSTWLTDMFGFDQVAPIFEHLNQVTGMRNTAHVTTAIEKLVYLSQAAINKATKKRGLIK